MLLRLSSDAVIDAEIPEKMQKVCFSLSFGICMPQNLAFNPNGN